MKYARARSTLLPAASIDVIVVRANCAASCMLPHSAFCAPLTGISRRPNSLRVGNVSPTLASFVNQALRLWATLQGYGTREVIRWIEEETADEFIRSQGEAIEAARLLWAEGRARVEAL